MDVDLMDIYIFETSVVFSIIFIIAHIVLFRKIARERALLWLYRIYAALGGIYILFTLIIIKSNELGVGYTTEEIFGASLIAFVMINLYVFLYVLGIFGIITSSLRIALLEILAKKGKRGLSLKEITYSFNKEKIVLDRLNKLSRSKELVYTRGKYKINRNPTIFRWQYFLLELLSDIFLSQTAAHYKVE